MKLSELTDRIYDTLMNNVGMSQWHTGFPLDRVTLQEVDASRCEMQFRIDGHDYKVTVGWGDMGEEIL